MFVIAPLLMVFLHGGKEKYEVVVVAVTSLLCFLKIEVHVLLRRCAMEVLKRKKKILVKLSSILK